MAANYLRGSAVQIDSTSRLADASARLWHILEITGALIAAAWLSVPVAGQLYIIAMAFDVLTGVLAAGKIRKWSSKGMSLGLRIKAGESLVIGMLFVVEHFNHLPLGTGIAGWFAFREIGSALENLTRMGVQLPPWLAGRIKQMEDRSEPPDQKLS